MMPMETAGMLGSLAGIAELRAKRRAPGHARRAPPPPRRAREADAMRSDVVLVGRGAGAVRGRERSRRALSCCGSAFAATAVRWSCCWCRGCRSWCSGCCSRCWSLISVAPLAPGSAHPRRQRPSLLNRRGEHWSARCSAGQRDRRRPRPHQDRRCVLGRRRPGPAGRHARARAVRRRHGAAGRRCVAPAPSGSHRHVQSALTVRLRGAIAWRRRRLRAELDRASVRGTQGFGWAARCHRVRGTVVHCHTRWMAASSGFSGLAVITRTASRATRGAGQSSASTATAAHDVA